MGKKVRLDDLVVARGLATSKVAAQALILAGKVRVPGVSTIKPGEPVSPDQAVQRAEEVPFVSRGGLKLQAALEGFGIQVMGRCCVDIGASTGGFTDCLLQRGAAKVLAVDVGHGQLDWTLRKDPRVANLEKKHVLKLWPKDIAVFIGSGRRQPLLVTVDISFISLTKVLPHLAELFSGGAEFVFLIKPQFEVEPKRAPRGVVRDPDVHREVIQTVEAAARKAGFECLGTMESPLRWSDGNREFLFHGRTR